MVAQIIDGKLFSQRLRDKVALNVADLKNNHKITPGLAVVLVGEDPASQVYVKSKGKQTKEAGMNSYEYKLKEDTLELDLLKLVNDLNNDDAVHGILVQLPLPKQIDERSVIDAIAVEKDVDGFHAINSGRLSIGGDMLNKAFIPCTPLGSLLLLKDNVDDLTGKNAVVVGRSNIVGKPMS